MRIKCGQISANGPHAAKYRIADLKETSDYMKKNVKSDNVKSLNFLSQIDTSRYVDISLLVRVYKSI